MISESKLNIEVSVYEYLVIGMGLIGSAALRHLSNISRDIAGIGPAEPPSYPNHKGVFASHYDQGRITRILDADLVWATLAQRSIARYRELEALSGVKFYSEIGCMLVGDSPDKQELLDVQRVGDQLGVAYERLPFANLKNKFPYLQFRENSCGLFEAANAGFVNPRELIEAQLRIAQKNGAQVIRQTAVSIVPNSSHVSVRTDDGKDLKAKKVIITAGAFTNCHRLLDEKLSYQALARTVLLAKLTPESVKELSSMPSIIFRSAQGVSIYVLPPVQYPDGAYYVKIGGSFIDADMKSLEEFEAFFHTDGSASTAKQLRVILQELLPGLRPSSYATRPCVVAITETSRPYVDTVIPSRIFAAAGGCGAAAKSSDEIGRLAASLAENGAWQDNLEASQFTSHPMPVPIGKQSCGEGA